MILTHKNQLRAEGCLFPWGFLAGVFKGVLGMRSAASKAASLRRSVSFAVYSLFLGRFCMQILVKGTYPGSLAANPGGMSRCFYLRVFADPIAPSRASCSFGVLPFRPGPAKIVGLFGSRLSNSPSRGCFSLGARHKSLLILLLPKPFAIRSKSPVHGQVLAHVAV